MRNGYEWKRARDERQIRGDAYEHKARGRHVATNEYETVTNENERETRDKHVGTNEYETIANGYEHETSNRQVVMNE